MQAGRRSLPSKLDPYGKARLGVGSHATGKGGKGQGNITFPDGYIALLYQTRPHTIEPSGYELQTHTSLAWSSLSCPFFAMAHVCLENIWSVLKVSLLLRGSFSKWIPFPKYQVLPMHSTSAMLDEVLNLIL